MNRPLLLIPFAAPQVKISYLLRGQPEKCAFRQSLTGFVPNAFTHIYTIIKADDDQRLGLTTILSAVFASLHLDCSTEIIRLEAPTSGQAETIAKALEILQYDGPFWTKDPDNFFPCEVIPENVVTVFPLDGLTNVNPQNKSYISISDDDYIMNIAEKRIIGRFFCTGGYGFESARNYLRTFQSMPVDEKIYLSHVIYQMLLDGEHFRPYYVSEYNDWGTEDEWKNRKQASGTLPS